MFKKSRFAVWVIICAILGFVFILPFFSNGNGANCKISYGI